MGKELDGWATGFYKTYARGGKVGRAVGFLDDEF
jgi:hypothetical protein